MPKLNMINSIAREICSRYEHERFYASSKGFFNGIIKKFGFERYLFALDSITEGDRVLDAACGTGYGSAILSEKAGTVYGLDIDRKVIDENRKAYEGYRIRFSCLNAVNTGFSDGFFDAVVSFETIEHIRDFNLFIDEIHRVLKKGGSLLLSTPNKSFSDALFGYSEKPFYKYHKREFETQELCRLLKRRFGKVEIFIQGKINRKSKLSSYISGFSYLFRHPSVCRKEAGTAGMENIFLCRK